MIVNGDDRAVSLLDAVLESGRYDVVFVESTAHAYSRIKRLRPNLVVICTQPGDLGAFQVLTMLKLDEDTRSISVLTCAMEDEGEDAEGDPGALGVEIEIPVPAPAGRPN
jgi:CheY-like chemotaxis protein